MYPPPAIKTSHAELVGTTAGIILTAVVAVAGLAVMIGAVFLADVQPDIGRRQARRRGELGGRGPWAGVSLGQGGFPAEQIEHRHLPEGGHPHGKPASWVLVAVVIAAFTTGGIAIIAHAWRSREEQLVAQAGAWGAPSMAREEAARALGAEPEELEAALREPPGAEVTTTAGGLPLVHSALADTWGTWHGALDAPTARWLCRTMRSAELAGADPAEIVRHAVAQ